MQKVQKIGNIDWTVDEIKKSIPIFIELYKNKPIADNQGGMKSPHMFAAWFMLKKINPKNVIESGVWKGQGTWLIETTLPEANIFSIDLNLKKREYISDKVKYFNKDFSKIDWSMIENKEDTLLFFDDHQNAVERVMLCERKGFKHLVFEDNYPENQGDCYSLKKALQYLESNTNNIRKNFFESLKQRIRKNKIERRHIRIEDSKYLKDVLDIYYEFPPVFKNSITRWGDNWDDENYLTPEPLYKKVEEKYLEIFQKEAIFYTWFCYAKLK